MFGRTTPKSEQSFQLVAWIGYAAPICPGWLRWGRDPSRKIVFHVTQMGPGKGTNKGVSQGFAPAGHQNF